jgi:hypothetical protein
MLPEAKQLLALRKQAIAALSGMREQRFAFSPTLRLPKNGSSRRGIDIKSVKACFTTIRTNDIENIWSQMCTYGENLRWSHKDFKLALKMTLPSECQRHFGKVEHHSLKSILSSLTSRYIVETMTTKMSALRNFTRDINEPLQAALERYKTLLLYTEASVPVDERKQRNKDYLSRALETICSNTAKQAIAELKNNARFRGSYANYNSLRQTAILAEESNNDLPSEERAPDRTLFATKVQPRGTKEPYSNSRSDQNRNQRQQQNSDPWDDPLVKEAFADMEETGNSRPQKPNYQNNSNFPRNGNPARKGRTRGNQNQNNRGARNQNDNSQNNNSSNFENANNWQQNNQRQSGNPKWQNGRRNNNSQQNPMQRDDNFRRQKPNFDRQRSRNDNDWPQGSTQFWHNTGTQNGFNNTNPSYFDHQNRRPNPNWRNNNRMQNQPRYTICTNGYDFQMCNNFCTTSCPLKRDTNKSYWTATTSRPSNNTGNQMSTKKMKTNEANSVLAAMMAS